MLRDLHIRNYALIRQADLDFSPGFCVITGETGAGKSILVGALGLLLGNRADTGVLFEKDRKCVIEAGFEASGTDLPDFFQQHDLDWNNGDLILRREILPAGKSRAFVNDTPVTLPVLKEISAALVDIHSQHGTLALNTASFQLRLLDSYLSDKSLPALYRECYRQYESIRRQLADLRQRRDQTEKEKDYWQFLYQELCSLQLKEGEQEEMEQALETLSHAQALRETFAESLARLDGEELGVLPLLKQTVRDLRKIAPFHSGLSASMERWEPVVVEIDDLRCDLQKWMDSVNDDPALKQRYEERLDLLYRMEKKHQVEDVSGLIRIRESLSGKLQESETGQAELERLEEVFEKKQQETEALALRLSQARREAAESLQAAILKALSGLAMGNARLEIALAPLPAPGPEGKDRISFLFSANPGAPMDEIAKVASGGELSRLMLAVKSVVHQDRLIGTLILDEIDTGVSGNIAAKVARMMKGMSRHMQVIAITHLPQIAAAADAHYWVCKSVEGGESASHLRKLDARGHLEHIASMLSNGNPGPAAMRAAEEMIRG